MTDYGLIHGDALRIPLRDASVDALISSPPYFALRSYRDEGEHYDGQIGSEDSTGAFLAALWAVMDECYRVLKPTGSAFINLGDSYAGSGGHNNAGVGGTGRGPSRYNQSRDVPVKSLRGLPWRFALGLTCPDQYRHAPGAGTRSEPCAMGDTSMGTSHDPGLSGPRPGAPGAWPQWTLRAELIWSKPNGLPESVTDRVRRSHEQWFHLTRGPKYYAGVDEIREVHVDPRRGANGGARDLHTDQMSRKWNPGENNYNPLGKLPGSVWTIPSEPLVVPDHIGVDHFAAFPQEWCRRLILGWTPNGICTKCGEGRRPVVEKALAVRNRNTDPRKYSTGLDDDAAGNWSAATEYQGSTEATITGYACACDVTLAPTRPAVVFDPFVGTGTVPMVARALGRFGVGLDLSRDYLRLARWRIGESRHGAKSTNRTNRERQGNLW